MTLTQTRKEEGQERKRKTDGLEKTDKQKARFTDVWTYKNLTCYTSQNPYFKLYGIFDFHKKFGSLPDAFCRKIVGEGQRKLKMYGKRI